MRLPPTRFVEIAPTVDAFNRMATDLERVLHQLRDREAELADGFKKQGLDVYAPDVAAFRTYAQKIYLGSDEAKSWAPGVLDKIAAIK